MKYFLIACLNQLRLRSFSHKWMYLSTTSAHTCKIWTWINPWVKEGLQIGQLEAVTKPTVLTFPLSLVKWGKVKQDDRTWSGSDGRWKWAPLMITENLRCAKLKIWINAGKSRLNWKPRGWRFAGASGDKMYTLYVYSGRCSTVTAELMPWLEAGLEILDWAVHWQQCQTATDCYYLPWSCLA